MKPTGNWNDVSMSAPPERIHDQIEELTDAHLAEVGGGSGDPILYK